MLTCFCYTVGMEYEFHAVEDVKRFWSYSILIESQVLSIRKSSATQAKLAKIYNTNQSNISYIKRGKTWKHILQDNH